jgi:hypothetical protein
LCFFFVFWLLFFLFFLNSPVSVESRSGSLGSPQDGRRFLLAAPRARGPILERVAPRAFFFRPTGKYVRGPNPKLTCPCMGDGRRQGSPFQDPIPAYRLRRVAPSFCFPRRMTSGLRYLSRRLHREQGTGTWARETKDPTPSSALPPPRQRKPSAPRHPAARQEPWPSSIPARVKRATTATRCTGQKPPFSPRPSVPFRGTDGRSGRDGDAGLRECGGGARKTQAKPNQGRRPDAHRGVTSVLPSPWTDLDPSGAACVHVSPWPPTCTVVASRMCCLSADSQPPMAMAMATPVRCFGDGMGGPSTDTTLVSLTRRLLSYF